MTKVGGKTQPNPPGTQPIPPLTAETLKTQLGYPDIYVDTSKRKKQCPNCGCEGHDEKECKSPTMEKLFEAFGARAFDSSQPAIEEKMKIVNELLK